MEPKALGQMIEGMVKSTKPKPEEGWTLGWDVVVSYSEEEINQSLRSRWEKSPADMLTKIETYVEEEDLFSGDTFTVKYNLELSTPLIRFIKDAIEPAVNLYLPVVSGFAEKVDSDTKQSFSPPQRANLPSNSYEICLAGIKLGTVTGRYEDIKNKPQRTAKTLPVKNICEFKDADIDRFEVSWVVLDFPLKGDLNVSASVKPDAKDKAAAEKKLKRVKDAAQIFFEGPEDHIDLIRHSLATVKNKRPKAQAGVTVDLTPKSFRMGTYRGTYAKDSILSIFIHVAGGKNAGEKNNLQGSWQGQWLLAKIAPIPADHTASILINPELVFDLVLGPQLLKGNAGGKWTLKHAAPRGGGGITMKANWDGNFKHETFEVRGPDWQDGQSLKIQGWDVPLKDKDALIHLYQKDMEGPPVAYFDWEFPIDSEWTLIKRRSGTPNPHNPEPRYKELGVTNYRTTFTLKQDIPLSIKATDDDVTFNVVGSEVDKQWTQQNKEIPFADGSWDKIIAEAIHKLFGHTKLEDILKEQRQALLQEFRPTIEFGTTGLGFFLTTNLLNPGARVIDIDKDVGMRMPGDLLLVGKVVQSSDPVKA